MLNIPSRQIYLEPRLDQTRLAPSSSNPTVFLTCGEPNRSPLNREKVHTRKSRLKGPRANVSRQLSSQIQGPIIEECPAFRRRNAASILEASLSRRKSAEIDHNGRRRLDFGASSGQKKSRRAALASERCRPLGNSGLQVNYDRRTLGRQRKSDLTSYARVLS